MSADEQPKRRTTLHGLGFAQVDLGKGMWVHCWHPNFPRRQNSEQSKCHNHRFRFKSTVLAGTMINHSVGFKPWTDQQQGASYKLYDHPLEARGPHGNRPWKRRRGFYAMETLHSKTIRKGDSYLMAALDFHWTEPIGPVVTLMQKVYELKQDCATTAVEGSYYAEEGFDRYQWSEEVIWSHIFEALNYTATCDALFKRLIHDG